jgi:DNA-binding NarL/FixJ family response regulator
MGTPIRVAIVATFPLLHEGLVRILGDDPSLSVVPDRFTCASLAGVADRLKVNLAVVHLPATDQPCAWDTIASLCDKLKVLILLKHYEHESVKRALELGVMGILTEDAGGMAIFKAIHEVAAGGIWCETRPPFAAANGPRSQPSQRERDVLALIRQGLSNRDIAERLFISERTVKSHVNRLLHKFQMKNRVQLAIYTDGVSVTQTSPDP